jgi:hypothetical protein
MAASGRPVTQQPLPASRPSFLPHAPYEALHTHASESNLPSTQGGEKTRMIVDHATCEAIQLTTDAGGRKFYIPTELRTGFLVAFCLVTLLVFALLQIAAAASLGAEGLESLSVFPTVARRGASPQSTDPCNSGATCAPAPGSWANPSSLETTPAIVGAPPPGSWTRADSTYLLGAYVPTFAAIVFSIWWKCVFARLKEMEPYYQLTRFHGAEAKDSLFLSYSNAMLPAILFKSFWSRHWTTFIGAVNMSLVTICTLLAAETLHISSVGDGCGVIADAKGDFNEDCKMRLAMQPALGFLLGFIVLAMFLGTSLLLMRLRRHPTGLSAEATSIAGVASHTHAIIEQRLLQNSSTSSHRFTIIAPSDYDTKCSEPTPSIQAVIQQLPEASRLVDSRSGKHVPREMRMLSLIAFLIYQVATVVLIVYYSFVSKPGTKNTLEEFMDSETFGVRLFMTAVGLGTKFYWGWIERYMRRMYPILAMAAPNGATAQESVLMVSHSHPVTALFNRSTWRHRRLGLVTLMTVLTEVLVVLLNTIPFSTATAYMAWRISVILSIIFLGPMILTTLSVMRWMTHVRQIDAKPDIPESIADVLVMIQDMTIWTSLGGLPERERNSVVNSWQARFAVRIIDRRWKIVVLR